MQRVDTIRLHRDHDQLIDTAAARLPVDYHDNTAYASHVSACMHHNKRCSCSTCQMSNMADNAVSSTDVVIKRYNAASLSL